MQYICVGPVWLHPGAGGWHFFTIDVETSGGLRAMRGPSTAWGSIRVDVVLIGHRWSTSVFPDSKSGTFLLPIKADVRRRTGVKAGDIVTVELEISA